MKVSEDGSGIKGESVEDLVKSDDPNFRPTAVDVAPDGSIYFLDWSNQLIGHMQHHIRDPNRDHAHGRIYRITYEGRPLLKPEKIDGQPVDKRWAMMRPTRRGHVRFWHEADMPGLLLSGRYWVKSGHCYAVDTASSNPDR